MWHRPLLHVSYLPIQVLKTSLREGVLKPSARVISCGALPTPSNGRKSTFAFTPGTMVKFDCDPGYVLMGERRRWCYDTGDWNWAENGDANCLSKSEYSF